MYDTEITERQIYDAMTRFDNLPLYEREEIGSQVGSSNVWIKQEGRNSSRLNVLRNLEIGKGIASYEGYRQTAEKKGNYSYILYKMFLREEIMTEEVA